MTYHSKIEAPAAAKLTPEDVQEIREMLRAGIPGKKIAEKYNVSNGTISSINHRRSWNHIPAHSDDGSTTLSGAPRGPNKGEVNKCSKLKESDIREIRALIRYGEKTSRIAELYNISSSAITNIRKRYTWKHVPDIDGDGLPIKINKEEETREPEITVPKDIIEYQGMAIRTTQRKLVSGSTITLPRISVLEGKR